MAKIHEIGARIHAERKKMGITQPQLARAVGATTDAVFRWEKGRNIPGLIYFIRMCELFKKPVKGIYDTEE
jgi:DNA-binding XRE family transcriptional regulator